MANAFPPILASHGGGTLVNILSLGAWISVPTGYADDTTRGITSQLGTPAENFYRWVHEQLRAFAP